jgi:putative endonuclease
MAESEWTVYMIESESGKLYTGITNDLHRRLQEHQSGSRGARFFHFSDAKAVVYQESQPNRSEATKREAAIKRLNRQQKLALIQQQATNGEP